MGIRIQDFPGQKSKSVYEYTQQTLESGWDSHEGQLERLERQVDMQSRMIAGLIHILANSGALGDQDAVEKLAKGWFIGDRDK